MTGSEQVLQALLCVGVVGNKLPFRTLGVLVVYGNLGSRLSAGG
jgi:hypothetical protein